MKKKCTTCGIEKPFECFSKHPKGKFGIRSECKQCKNEQSREQYKNNSYKKKEYYKEIGRFKRHNITRDIFNIILKNQNSSCAICNRCFSKWYIDHDHSCCSREYSCGDCIRGILCAGCNAALAWYERKSDKINEYVKKPSWKRI